MYITISVTVSEGLSVNVNINNTSKVSLLFTDTQYDTHRHCVPSLYLITISCRISCFSNKSQLGVSLHTKGSLYHVNPVR